MRRSFLARPAVFAALGRTEGAFGRRNMRSTISVALLVVATSVGGIGAENVNPHAQILEDFEARIREYTKLRQQAEAGLPALKPTDSPEEIRRHEHLLAQAIRRQRGRAKQGDLFTPKISAEFRRLIGRLAILSVSIFVARPVLLSTETLSACVTTVSPPSAGRAKLSREVVPIESVSLTVSFPRLGAIASIS